MKSVIFMNPWNGMCSIAPSIPPGVSNAAPKSMSDSWFIVEYASLFFRLSCARANRLATTIVKMAIAMSAIPSPSACIRSTPKT